MYSIDDTVPIPIICVLPTVARVQVELKQADDIEEAEKSKRRR